MPYSTDGAIEGVCTHGSDPQSIPPPGPHESPILLASRPSDRPPDISSDLPSDLLSDPFMPGQSEGLQRSELRPQSLGEGLFLLPKESNQSGTSSTILDQQRLLQQFLIHQQEVQGRQQQAQLRQLIPLIQPRGKRRRSSSDFEEK